MELLNIAVEVNAWTQIHDGVAPATISIVGSGSMCQVCQSDSAPDPDVVGLPLVGGSISLSAYHVTAGSPVFVKALNEGAVMIVNA